MTKKDERENKTGEHATQSVKIKHTKNKNCNTSMKKGKGKATGKCLLSAFHTSVQKTV